MAAAASQDKQLREFLQEQQEPFILKTYLAEKGCCKRTSLEQEGSFTCCRVTSGKKGQKGLSKVVRNLYDQVGSIKGKKKLKGKKKRQKQSSEAEERLSLACCSSKNPNWCSPDVEGRASSSSSFVELCNSNEEKWRCMEDEDQQCSPVSVLEGLASQEEDASSPPTKKSSSREKWKQVSVDESIIASASVWGVVAEATGTGAPLKSSSLELEKTKKQLMFDCIHEEMEVEAHYSSRMTRPQAWSKRCQRRDGLELLSEWSDDQREQRREMGVEIGDAILDEIMVELIGP